MVNMNSNLDNCDSIYLCGFYSMFCLASLIMRGKCKYVLSDDSFCVCVSLGSNMTLR